jgi:hypothetical protein
MYPRTVCVLVALASLNPAQAAPPPAPYCKVSPELNRAAHDFMKSHGLIRDGEETVHPTVRTVWTLTETRVIDGRCVLLMDLCTVYGGETYCEKQAVEALVLHDQKLMRFEEGIATPQALRVGIGLGITTNAAGEYVKVDSNYYVELTGASAAEAWKTIRLKLLMGGLLADISAKDVKTVGGKLTGKPDGAAPFDPTPGRKWKLKNVVWDLRRQNTTEIGDVYAGQLDSNFGAYFSGSDGGVTPWSALIIQVFDPNANVWKETGIRKALYEKYTHPSP